MTITTDDLETLNPGAWLNDTIILFVLRYIQYETQIATSGLRRVYNFIPPTVAIAMKNAMKNVHDVQRMKDEFLENDARTKTWFHIIMVNGTGSHWSLLWFSRSNGTFYHYNSNRSSFSEFDVTTQSFHGLNLGVFAKACGYNYKIDFIEVICAQQENSCDCALYGLIHLMCVLLQTKNNKKNGQFYILGDVGKPTLQLQWSPTKQFFSDPKPIDSSLVAKAREFFIGKIEDLATKVEITIQKESSAADETKNVCFYLFFFFNFIFYTRSL